MGKENQARRYGFDDLQTMMARLRDPDDGCPWDLEQTPQTIINYSIEEVYELAEVVERLPLDYSSLQDELGDVLLQVVFFAQFAQEDEKFSVEDVVDHLCRKMIRRHPHVFPGGVLEARRDKNTEAIDSGDVKQSWSAIKKAEKAGKMNAEGAEKGVFANIPEQLPALLRAAKFQKRAAKIGLDWDGVSGAMAKVQEESHELLMALEKTATTSDTSQLPGEKATVHESDPVEEELGDLLFSVVNVARKLDKNPEQLLRQATRKFAYRVDFVAQQLDDRRQSSTESSQSGADAALLDELWEKSKRLSKT